MHNPIFDPFKCDVPALDKLPRDRFITDCTIPAPPKPLRQCPDLDTSDFPLPDLPLTPPLIDEPSEDCRTTTVKNVCEGTVGNLMDGPVAVRNINFRKDSSFRIWGQPSAVCPDQFDITVDIGGGPSHSVFWQDVGGDPPKWTTCPKLGHSLTVGTKDQPGWLFSVSPAGTVFGIAAGDNTDQLWRAPNASAPGPNSHLIVVGITGKCHQLGWSYQGIDHTRYEYDGTVSTYKQGLLVSVSGSNFNHNNPGATCNISDCSPFDPCNPPVPNVNNAPEEDPED